MEKEVKFFETERTVYKFTEADIFHTLMEKLGPQFVPGRMVIYSMSKDSDGKIIAIITMVEEKEKKLHP